MTDWWTGDPSEIFWCEITDRVDFGSDLKCPQSDERGRRYWSYDLIQSVMPGDIVFHYSTLVRAFVGASVAGGPLEDRSIVWAPHGTVGRADPSQRHDRPGWWLPLYGFRRAESPLSINALRNPVDEDWIRAWISEKERTPGVQRVAAPFQRYGGPLRASQGYLTKMPKEFVDRWPDLTAMADRVSALQDALVPLGDILPLVDQGDKTAPTAISLKREDDYLAVVRASIQRRSRHHERLVRQAIESLRDHGAKVSTPHPLDLFVHEPMPVIIEAELVQPRGIRSALREAIGQLHDYRYFESLPDAALCVLLDQHPGNDAIAYLEEYHGLLLLWWSDGGLVGGPRTAAQLASINVQSG